MSKIKFSIISKDDKKIIVTEYRWLLITKFKHPIMHDKEKEVKETITNPDQIRISKIDCLVFLYYKKFQDAHVCVVVKHIHSKGFIITTYITTFIKQGEIVWKK
jgi:hypothetical protein